MDLPKKNVITIIVNYSNIFSISFLMSNFLILENIIQQITQPVICQTHALEKDTQWKTKTTCLVVN